MAQNHGNANEANNVNAFINLATLNTPDIIKNLPEFVGNTKDIHNFIKAVDPISNLLAQTPAATQPFWLQAIRNKIKGEASDRLRLHGEPSTWIEIKNCLLRHFTDHRDLRTLYNQLNNIKQTGSVQRFYDDILEIVTALNVKINSEENNENIKEMLIERNLTEGLQTFMAGIREPIKTILLSRNPDSLNTAFEIAIQIQDNSFKTNTFNNTNYRASNLQNPQNNRLFRQNSYQRNYQNNTQDSLNPNHFPRNYQNFAQTHAQNQFQRNHINVAPRQNPQLYQNNQVEAMDVDPSANVRNNFTNSRRNFGSGQNRTNQTNHANSSQYNNNNNNYQRSGINREDVSIQRNNNNRIISEELFPNENFQEQGTEERIT